MTIFYSLQSADRKFRLLLIFEIQFLLEYFTYDIDLNCFGLQLISAFRKSMIHVGTIKI